MTEQELRVLVREAIAQQLGRAAGGLLPSAGRAEAVAEAAREAGGRSLVPFSRFAVPSGPDGTCIIEPSVMCNHCGYCKSYGH